jgi:hypothetical protein
VFSFAGWLFLFDELQFGQIASLSISRQSGSRVLPFRANRREWFSDQSREGARPGVPVDVCGLVAAAGKQLVEFSSNARKSG